MPGPPPGGVAPTLVKLAPRVGLLALFGACLPLDAGWGLPLLVLAGFCVLLWLQRGGASVVPTTLPPRLHWVAVGMATLAAAVVLCVAARSFAAVLIAFPGTWMALLLLPLGLVAGIRHRAGLGLILIMVVAVPALGVMGARHEAAGEQAHGWAQTGPIHGIHPGQTTAVLVDGLGPFDIPINDFVEPSGDKGYSPQTLAVALRQALQKLAELHFANGPKRAHRALAGVQVEATTAKPVAERLDRPAPKKDQWRLLVTSGGVGQGSRVEFVCPGRRSDPRGQDAADLMQRMCPNKYASEASAGLSVTGRWPGYAEGRGGARLGLAPWFGWTRSDDAAGREVIAREQRWLAWLLVGLGALVVAVGVRGRVAGAAVRGLASVGAAVGAAVAVVAIAAGVMASGVGGPAFIEHAPAWSDLGLAAWLPLLALGAAMTPWPGGQAVGRSRWDRVATVVPVAIVGLATIVCARSIDFAAWATPTLYPLGHGVAPGHAGLALKTWVVQFADSLTPLMGLNVYELETALASALAFVLLGLVAAVVHGLAGVVGEDAAGAVEKDLPETKRRSLMRRGLSTGVLLTIAAGLVLSRKTEGATTLLPAAAALMLVLHSGLGLVGRFTGPKLAEGGWRHRFPHVVHVGWVGVAVWLSVSPLLGAKAVHADHPFVLLCALGGLVVALTGLFFLKPVQRSDA